MPRETRAGPWHTFERQLSNNPFRPSIMAEQIDKLSKQCCKLTQGEKRYVKRLHVRSLRRAMKRDQDYAPSYNRYNGWIA
jgi:hypothetical protein